ncbi:MULTISPECIES: hypothetical protein [Nocardia]|uniref:hypothetical protein n=1 Tax=Nocardia TaxID=1817 RepID=UPI0007A3B001|nr:MULTISPECIES: hypothetical protein [Nocardia]
MNPADAKIARINEQLTDAHKEVTDAQARVIRLQEELAVAYRERDDFNTDVTLAYQAFNRG